jgi:hypothetical protein
VSLSATGELRSFASLSVHLADVRFHRVGQPRDLGWDSLELITEEVDLMGKQRIVVARGRLPGMTYDRVWPVVTSGQGVLDDGRPIEMEVIVEPIALVPQLGAEEVAEIELALVVLKRPEDSRYRYVMFTKGVQTFKRDW